ncbi:MAG: sulfatase-like hydrolase/transferase, partial [Bacteroidota bacterium]
QHFIDGKSQGWERRQYLFSGKKGEGCNILKIAPSRYVQNEFVDRAIDFIERQDENPFFLYLPWTIAHAELSVPRSGDPDYHPEDKGLLEQYLDDEGKSIFPEFDYQGDKIYGRPNPYMTRATLAAMISRLDRDIGKLLISLHKQYLAQNTIIILTSDNGPHDEAGVDPKQIDGVLDSPFNSSGGLKGFKRSLYEGGVRVPMIVYWPGALRRGAEIDWPYANFDIGPTLLELAGIEPMEGIDGESFASVLSDTPIPSFPRHLYFQFREQQSLVYGAWKLYRGQNESGNDPIEFYNVVQDPGETNNLAALPEYQERIQQMKAIMNEENADSPCRFVPFKLEP